MPRYSLDALTEFTVRVFRHHGVPEADAQQAADVLRAGDRRGIDSHGVARLLAYHRKLDAGVTNPAPQIRVVRELPGTATVDGDNGLGLVVGPAANRIAMDKAQAVGSGWVSVCNTNHFGIAGYYVLEALKQDLIGWAMTNASRLVVPLWGAERRLGTNPIAVGFPALEEPPIVIDMATSTVPYGKIEMARRLGQSIPHGWGIDAEGQSTTDPAAVVEGGGLVPLGGERERSGHKGYALSGMVDVLSGVLSGANWGPFTPPFGLGLEGGETRVGKGIGHCFGALQVAGFRDPLSFKQEVDHWIRTMRGTAPATGTNGPLVPGDPERIAAAERERDGVPLSPAVLADLRTVAHETGVPFD
ncbi:MAG: Ldh family oxidoreductase [Bacteroidota bacterium]